MTEVSETTLRRGVSIIFALGGEEALRGHGLGMTRVAEIVGREKSQVSRTLKTLVDCGALERDAQTLHYRLSWQLFALAARGGDRRLAEVAAPLLERLVGRLGETAHLSVRQGAEVLTVASRAPDRVVLAVGWVGRTTPAYCTSAGRALLMDHTAAQVRTLFAGVPFLPSGPNTPSTVDDLLPRLADAGRRGYAVTEEEHEPGLTGVAAPIRDQQGRVIAALNISGPSFRLGADLAQAGQEVVRTALEVSGLLGAPPAAGDQIARVEQAGDSGCG